MFCNLLFEIIPTCLVLSVEEIIPNLHESIIKFFFLVPAKTYVFLLISRALLHDHRTILSDRRLSFFSIIVKASLISNMKKTPIVITHVRNVGFHHQDITLANSQSLSISSVSSKEEKHNIN